MKSPVLTDLVHIIYIIIIQTISGEITSSDRPGTQSYINYGDLIWWNHQFWPTWYTIIHIRIIQNISGEITSSDWPDTQSYINYRDHIWWNHQFWLTCYTIIHQLYRPYLVKSPVLTDLVHIIHIIIIQTISGEITSSDRPGTQSYINYRDLIWWNHQFWPTWYTIIHFRIIQNISGEITSSDWPDTQSYINYRDHIWWNHQFWPTWYTLYISELYRPYLVKSPVLTDLVHIIHIRIIQTISGEIHIRIIQNISGEITSSDWPDTQLYINYRDHIWWNHQFWLTWYTIIHQL